MKVVAQINLPSAANMREHWAVRATRARQQRAQATLALRAKAPWIDHDGHIEITLTRVGARDMDDDNLASAFKAVRDGVADYLRIDDGSDRLTWVYAQRRPEKGEPRKCVVIELVHGIDGVDD